MAPRRSPRVLGALALCAALARAVTVSLAPAAPSGATPLHPALVSFSIEQDRWTDWVGTTSPNQFLLNALGNLAALTGETPWIRVGANTEDRTNFDYNTQYSSAVFPAYSAITPYPEATSVVVGDKYYEISSHLPEGTHMIWGLNLGGNNITAAYLMAQSILKAFDSAAVKEKGITLDFLEIGNEGDLYANNHLRDSAYNSATWVAEWEAFGTNITESFDLAARGVAWLGGSFAGSSHSTTGFSPQSIIAKGILDSAPGQLITTFSQHRYSAAFCSGNGVQLQELMRKKNVRGNLTDLIPDIQLVRSYGLDYIGGEMNSVACHGAPGVSNVAGAALWTLDYTLFASTLTISQVFFHEGIGFKYNLIQPAPLDRSITDGTPLPAPLAPHVQPQYYGALVVNEAIGTSGRAEAVELTIDDPYISGYAVYEDGALRRAVLINSKAWLQSDEGTRTRTVTHVGLAGIASSRRISVKRLAIGHADDASGLRWGGVSYETSSGRPQGRPTAQTSSASGGVNIQETEAVLVTFL